MSADEVTSAMRLGSNNPLNTRSVCDLGRFGLGLKTASFSQCRQLTVITRKQQQTSARQWDLDTITENPDNGWNLHILTDEEIKGIDEISSIIDDFMFRENGTIILWRKLDRLDNFDESGMGEKKLNSLINEARKHVELTFHRFLSSSRGKKVCVFQLIAIFLRHSILLTRRTWQTENFPSKKLKCTMNR